MATASGLPPAEVDRDGKEIIFHNPQFTSLAPWYLDPAKPHKKKSWYVRGVKCFQARKYPKGACQNCGVMTHSTRDCFGNYTNKFGYKARKEASEGVCSCVWCLVSDEESLENAEEEDMEMNEEAFTDALKKEDEVKKEDNDMELNEEAFTDTLKTVKERREIHS